jgi:ABC-type sugar transport system substrate-binding protein
LSQLPVRRARKHSQRATLNFPGIRVIEQPTYWKTDKAVAAAQTIVSSTPNLGAIYMESDSVTREVAIPTAASFTAKFLKTAAANPPGKFRLKHDDQPSRLSSPHNG